MTLAINAAAQAQRELRAGFAVHYLVWIDAKNRDTGQVQGVGFWTGWRSENITVTDQFSGVVQTLPFQAGALIKVKDLRFESGLNIRPVTISLSRLNESVLVAMMEYEPRGAPIQLWKRTYNTNGVPLGVEALDKGSVNKAPSEHPAGGGEWTIEAEFVSDVRSLTVTSTGSKSNESQKKRMGDLIRQHKTVAADWTVHWGTKDIRHGKGGNSGNFS
jgi:hypothetical protein